MPAAPRVLLQVTALTLRGVKRSVVAIVLASSISACGAHQKEIEITGSPEFTYGIDSHGDAFLSDQALPCANTCATKKGDARLFCMERCPAFVTSASVSCSDDGAGWDVCYVQRAKEGDLRAGKIVLLVLGAPLTIPFFLFIWLPTCLATQGDEDSPFPCAAVQARATETSTQR